MEAILGYRAYFVQIGGPHWGVLLKIQIQPFHLLCLVSELLLLKNALLFRKRGLEFKELDFVLGIENWEDGSILVLICTRRP